MSSLDSDHYYYFSSASHSTLSNFYLTDLTYKGTVYNCSEQAYQHQKALFHHQHKLAKDILSSTDPRKQLLYGKYIKTDISWKSKKVPIMYSILEIKFSTCPEFRAELAATRSKVLVENTLNPEWGVGRNRKGCNKLGVVLMELRHRLL